MNPVDSQDRSRGKKQTSGGSPKALVWGAVAGGGAGVALVMVFLALMSQKGGEAGADWAFVGILASPFVVGGGALIGLAAAALVGGIRSLKGRDGAPGGESAQGRAEPGAAADRPRD